MDKINNCFFMSGFDLTSFKSAGVIVTGTEENLSTPESTKFVNTIFDKIALLGGGMFYRGVYSEENIKFLRLYVIFNGMTLPEERINEMIKEINIGYTKIKSQENRVDGVFFEVDKRISNAFSSSGTQDGQKKIIRNPSSINQGGQNNNPSVKAPINIPGVQRRGR